MEIPCEEQRGDTEVKSHITSNLTTPQTISRCYGCRQHGARPACQVPRHRNKQPPFHQSAYKESWASLSKAGMWLCHRPFSTMHTLYFPNDSIMQVKLNAWKEFFLPPKLKILVFIHKSANAGTATPQAFSLSYFVWPNLDWEDQTHGSGWE